MQPPPARLRDEPLLQRTLHALIDKLDRGIKPQLKVTAKDFPELFDFLNPDAGYLWSLVEQLDKRYRVLTIEYSRPSPRQEKFEGARLRLNELAEPVVRAWLQRPAQDGYSLLWQALIERHSHLFDDTGSALRKTPLRVNGKTAEQVVTGFIRAGHLLQRPITLRQLSARAFWGHSKFLEHRERLLRETFYLRLDNLQPRPILLNVYLPLQLQQVLFIENQDTFVSMCKTAPTQTALVYSGGFRGTSGRARAPGGAVFAFLGNSCADVISEFERWWSSDSPRLECAFWGDLDWAGVAIFEGLRKSFPGLTAWRTGYDRLLAEVRSGGGHELDLAGKSEQSVLTGTGDHYVDTEIIACLRDFCRGLDQEWLDQEWLD